MPKLYRFLIAAIQVAVFTGGAVVLGLTSADDGPVPFALQTIAITFIATPALIAALASSVWSWRGDLARRHHRRLLAVTATTAVIAAGALIGTALTMGHSLVVIFAVVALATFPASVALGLAARRAETRAGVFDADADPGRTPPPDLVPLLRRGRRNGWIGAGVGLLVGGAGAIALLGTGGDEVPPITVAALALSIALLFAVIPRSAAGLRLSRALR